LFPSPAPLVDAKAA